MEVSILKKICMTRFAQKWLEARGYRVLRFWNGDVLAQTEEVLAAILGALRAQPLPTLPLKGGGGDNTGSS
jgi:hypothetical protein